MTKTSCAYIVLAACWWVLPSSLAAETRLPDRAPIRHDVSLSASGGLGPLIGCPDTERGLQLGADIARTLQANFAVTASVVPASRITAADYRDRTVILLGHLENN